MTVGGSEVHNQSYINNEVDVKMSSNMETNIIQHRHQTRQRHLSSTADEDIASSYFASQFGSQQHKQKDQQHAKNNNGQDSKLQSRRDSLLGTDNNCNNSNVATVMANAAAKVATTKQKQREEIQAQQAREVERQLCQREMTPDNLKVIEQKLIQFQREQLAEDEMEIQEVHTKDEDRKKQQHHRSQLTVQQLHAKESQKENTSIIHNGVQKPKELHKESSIPPQHNLQDQNYSYLNLLPPDGSQPHRTQPLEGGPPRHKSRSVTATPDREVHRKWSISSSTDYLNKTSKGNLMARNNPIGLAEPSVKRDGYAVGTTEGSMYRSTGNLNVAAGSKSGSRCGSEVRDYIGGNWRERRASTADIKGTGVRVGSNLVEPSNKPQLNMFNMPFGSSAKSSYMNRKTVSKHNQQQVSQSSQNSRVTRNNCHQNVTMAMPRISRRAQSLPRGQVTNEESSFRVSLPGSARTSRQQSVEPDHRQKKLSRHGSVEIFDGAYNLTVPNKRSRHASQTKLEQIHADHIKIIGETDDVSDCENKCDNEELTNKRELTINNKNDNVSEFQSKILIKKDDVSHQQSNSKSIQNASQHYQTSSAQQSTQFSSSICEKSTCSQTYSSSITSESVQSTSMQSSSHTSKEETTNQTNRKRNTSGSLQNTVVEGSGKFNISNGLRRSKHTSQENLSISSNQQATSQDTSHNSFKVGSALKGLDTALEKIATQQKKVDNNVQYVAKVASRQTSRRCSISVTNGDDSDVTNVTVSIPASRTGSRRGSVSLEGKGRRGRRESLDLYTVEYGVKLGGQNNKVTNMEEKTTFHMRVDDKSNTCSRCGFEGHTDEVHEASEYPQRRAIVDTFGWEPFKHWFYDESFRSWWQVTGCVGVPLYKIYPRKSEWRTEKPIRNCENREDGNLREE